VTRVAVIGTGAMGENHAMAVRDHPTLVLDSVVDVDADRADEVATAYGAGHAATEPDGALKRADAAIVATPSNEHIDPARKALAADAHLLLEKPVSTDLEEAREFAERCAETDLVTAVSFILRYESAYAAVREAAAAGEIGDIVAARAMRGLPMSNSRKAEPGEHPLFYMNIHDIDALTWCLGERVVEVTGYQRWGELTDAGVPDAHQILLRFESGATATLEGYGVLPEDVPGGIVAEFELIGTEGTASLTIPSDEVELHTDTYDRPDTRYWPVVNDRMDGAVRRQIDYFADAVAGEGEVLATVPDGVRAQVVAEAARHAIEGKVSVSPADI
jgi:predicted dehydrogenase